MGTFLFLLIVGVAVYYNRDKILKNIAAPRGGANAPTRKNELSTRTLVYIMASFFALVLIFSIEDTTVRTIFILMILTGFAYYYRKPLLRFISGFRQGYNGYSDKKPYTNEQLNKLKTTLRSKEQVLNQSLSAPPKSKNKVAVENTFDAKAEERKLMQQKYKISYVEAEADESDEKEKWSAIQQSLNSIAEKKNVEPVEKSKDVTPQKNDSSLAEVKERKLKEAKRHTEEEKYSLPQESKTIAVTERLVEPVEEERYATEQDSQSIFDRAFAFIERVFTAKKTGNRYERSERQTRESRGSKRNADGYLK